MKPFDLYGPLPEPGSTTVLEASAGTGKTFALAALVTRYVAEGVATLDQMLLVTFSRAATRELRERVRAQLLQALELLDTPPDEAPNDLIAHLLKVPAAERQRRAARLRHALANFDSATIATTHQFCHIVLKSLGVAGDADAEVTLVESLADLIGEIVDDVYLAQFGQQQTPPPLTRREAYDIAKLAVENPGAAIHPVGEPGGSAAAVRVEFVHRVLAELEPRKRRLRIQGYDDLLGRLAAALEPVDAPARVRMRQRWDIVMVDEFQDTDPIQWQVVERAFVGVSTVVLIGDPKQAIYAFRGGDVATYLSAAGTAGERHTLAVNRRTDRALLDAVHTVIGGTELGDPDIVVVDVAAERPGHRLAGAPRNDPFRLRVVGREPFGRKGTKVVPIGGLREHIAADMAADIARLLGSGATFDGEPLSAGDIAVIVDNRWDAAACREAFDRAGVPVVYSGDSDVYASPAAADWLCLIEAMEQTHRPALVRAAGLTAFFGESGATLAAGGDELTDRLAATLRDWADRARLHGVAAVYESANLAGMGRRVLGRPGGVRRLTDLAHLADLLQTAVHRDGLALPALAELLRARRDTKDTAAERNRRLDSDAAAVQMMTYWGSKGLEFPVVYLPFMFNRNILIGDRFLFHDDAKNRCLHIGGEGSSDYASAAARAAAESAGETLRLAYVALTRAQSQVVAWWGPSRDEVHGGLSRLLRGRLPGELSVPGSCAPGITDDEVRQRFSAWQAAGGPVVEESVIESAPALEPAAGAGELAVRTFARGVDIDWRRTSYSALVRAAEDRAPGVGSEPEITIKDDEVSDIPSVPALSADSRGPGFDLPSPMAGLPGGATFGSLVHAVLETADPRAEDLAAELTASVDRHFSWWPVEAPPQAIAEALVPVHDTPLGPLAAGLTLRDIPLSDRLRELEFEIPLAGGDLTRGAPDVTLGRMADVLAQLLPGPDPMRAYADRLRGPGLGPAKLRGYLSGSIDAVLRVRGGDAGHRYVVVDYKTNRLGDVQSPSVAGDYTPDRLAAAMMHSDYVLQALLYNVVLHRFLRWRLPDYQPERHLGGVLYLFLRGMCGADTPVVDGHPTGVFSWRPPADLVVALSDLLDGRQVGS